MRNFIELTTKAGKRQKCLLFELEKQNIICLNIETGLWMRGALICKIAKDLLLKTDETIDEKIKKIEPLVLNIEKQAKLNNCILTGNARNKLNNLYKTKSKIYK
jgi:hypothetical protein